VSRSICGEIVDQGRGSNGTTTMTSSISTNKSLSLQDVEVQVIVDRNSQLYKEHLKTAEVLESAHMSYKSTMTWKFLKIAY
jgi:hypothetical protein